MSLTIQNFRSITSGTLPAGLAAGQIAFNTRDRFMFIGDGTNQITVEGTALSNGDTAYGRITYTTIPTVSTTGYQIVDLDHQSISGSTQVVSVDDSKFGSPNAGTTITDALVLAQGQAAATPADSLQPGDQIIYTSAVSNPAGGAYVIANANPGPGVKAIKISAGVADASTQVKGIVQLATATQVDPTQGAPAAAATVATAQQLHALAQLVQGLQAGTTQLGTYNPTASNGQIATVNATGGTTRGFTTNAKIKGNAGTALAGDWFLVTQSGTISGEDDVNGTAVAGDHIVYDGGHWHLVSLGDGLTQILHGLGDVYDTNAITATSGDLAASTGSNTKGLLFRDSSVADGDPSAYRLANVIDLGTYG